MIHLFQTVFKVSDFLSLLLFALFFSHFLRVPVIHLRRTKYQELQNFEINNSPCHILHKFQVKASLILQESVLSLRAFKILGIYFFNPIITSSHRIVELSLSYIVLKFGSKRLYYVISFCKIRILIAFSNAELVHYL